MIYIDRTKVQPPDEWRKKAAKETERAKEFFATDELSQSRFEFKDQLWTQVKPGFPKSNVCPKPEAPFGACPKSA